MNRISIKTNVEGFEHVIPVLEHESKIPDDIFTGRTVDLEDVKFYFRVVLNDLWIPLSKEVAIHNGITGEILDEHLRTMEYPYKLINCNDFIEGSEQWIGTRAFVLTNEMYYLGAGAIMSEYVRTKLYEKFQCNIIILPISVDAIIILPEKYYSLEKNKKNLKEILNYYNSKNKEDVFLSNHIYYIDYINCCFRTID